MCIFCIAIKCVLCLIIMGRMLGCWLAFRFKMVGTFGHVQNAVLVNTLANSGQLYLFIVLGIWLYARGTCELRAPLRQTNQALVCLRKGVTTLASVSQKLVVRQKHHLSTSTAAALLLRVSLARIRSTAENDEMSFLSDFEAN